jgi:hypothetical protein
MLPVSVPLPPLPGVDPSTAPSPDDPGYGAWVESVAFSAEGVDRFLIWESLHRSPSERLRRMRDVLDSLSVAEPASHGEIFRALRRHAVDFVLVGSAAAVALGAGYTTEDLDVVPSWSPENLARLVAALEDLDARYLDPAGRSLRPDLDRLSANRLNLLVTRAGRLDVLRSIEPGLEFDALAKRARRVELEGAPTLVVELETLIRAKELTGRAKDRAHLPLLRELQRLRRERGEGG